MPPAARQDTFVSEPNDGALRRADGGRMAAFSHEWLQTLHVSLVEQFAENAQDVLYRSGYEWGLLDLVRLRKSLTMADGRQDLWQREPRALLTAWWAGVAEAGWGACTFDVTAIARGMILAELHDSAVVAAVGSSDQPVCHLYAGLFGAAGSVLARAERHAAELQCRALGADSCQFVIAPGAQVDSAESWRQQGATAAEIVRRLRT